MEPTGDNYKDGLCDAIMPEKTNHKKYGCCLPVGHEKLKGMKRYHWNAYENTYWPPSPLSTSLLPPLGDRSHHFDTKEVMSQIPKDNPLYEKIEGRLNGMTSGERYTLYRAVKALVLKKAVTEETDSE